MRKTDLAAHQLLTVAEIDAAPVDVFALAKAADADVVQHEFEEDGELGDDDEDLEEDIEGEDFDLDGEEAEER